MKKIFAALLALVSSVAFGATTVPIQLLNPTGSASGQAIVSTGASSAPAWGGIGINGIAAIAANTVLANATASSASPTAFAMPSCSASGSALNWTSGTGFTCGTGYAMLSGGTFTGAITPSQTAGIVGTTTNNNVNAGSVGEYVTATASSVALTTATNANVTSISLTAGDWDVSGGGSLQAAGSGTLTNMILGISTTSGAFGSTGTLWNLAFGIGANGGVAMALPVVRVSVAATTTVYCVAEGTFSSGSASASCLIRARRIR